MTNTAERINKIFNECQEMFEDRGDSYGDAYYMHKRIAVMWDQYLMTIVADRSLKAKDVANMMTMLKWCRQDYSHDRDNLVDATVYQAIAGACEDIDNE